MKDKQWMFGILAFAIMIIGVSTMLIQKNSANQANAEAQDNVYSLQNQIKTVQFENNAKENHLIYKQTGLSPDQVDKDQTLAQSFFQPAFEWTSGKEYDKARTDFQSSLGQNNKFVTEYMRENTKVDNYNKIDSNHLKSKFSSIDVYPTTSTSDGYNYIGIITYYIYKDADDLQSLDQLKSSQAIVSFSAIGDTKDRQISNVSAWSGIGSDDANNSN